MAKKKVAWLSGCAVCNAGIVSRIDELIAEGNSITEAAKIMEAEAFRTDGVLSISAQAIRMRYAHTKGSKSDQNEPNLFNEIRKLIRQLRTATVKLQRINGELTQTDITQIEGIEGFLAKADLAVFAKEFTLFLQYFKKGEIGNEAHKKAIAA